MDLTKLKLSLSNADSALTAYEENPRYPNLVKFRKYLQEIKIEAQNLRKEAQKSRIRKSQVNEDKPSIEISQSAETAAQPQV